jgi:drug/metabolite transporter (DMT)-like permease
MGRAYLAISVVTVLWAGNFSVAKIGMAQFDPFLVASLRIVLTAAAFYALLPREERGVTREDWTAVLPLSLTGIAANHYCFAAGIQRTTPAHSAIIHTLIPVLVVLAGAAVLAERPTRLGLLGIGVAGAGVALVVLGGETPADRKATLAGDLLTFFGIVAFSIYTVAGRRLLGRMRGFRAVTLAFVTAVPFVLPVLGWSLTRQDWSRVDGRGWLSLAYMLVCANWICYGLHIYALSRLSAARVAAFVDLQPAIGISISVALGQDVLGPGLVAGSLVAIAGVVLVQLRR